MVTEIKSKILNEFFVNQVWGAEENDPDRRLNDDECPGLRYDDFERVTDIPRDMLKPIIHELRNDGLIELKMTVDYDCNPYGSAWFLTDKGFEHCKLLFLIKHSNV